MQCHLYYRPYRPAGMHFDGQWDSEQPEGWYVFANVDIIVPIIKWMNETKVNYKIANNWIIITKESDAAMFKLRWT